MLPLDNISTEFMDIGDIKTTYMINKTIFFFPSGYAISESFWSGLVDRFKTLNNFSCSLTCLAYMLSKGITCRFIVCGSHCLEVLRS